MYNHLTSRRLANVSIVLITALLVHSALAAPTARQKAKMKRKQAATAAKKAAAASAEVASTVGDDRSATALGPALGERAAWMRGSWGLNWKPARYANGHSEQRVSIEPFLEQISAFKTIDYLQLHLNESSIHSPVHAAPHELLESFWQGDVDKKKKPINLIVPRASKGVDPFGDWLRKTKAAGLKTQVYVNSFNLLNRGNPPADFPDVTARWKKYCDETPAVQSFIQSKPYHTHEKYPNRQYLFCYAEFVLKDYAIRYGDLIDAWLFDSARCFNDNGDNPQSGKVENQRIYQAFSNALRAGNPNAPVSFNNGTGVYARVTRFDDYTFGHPFGGGKNLGDHPSKMYDKNYRMITKIVSTNGYVHNGPKPFNWDNKVVGHFDPPMSTTRWNNGMKPGLTDEEFLLWNEKALTHGGAISWGLPLNLPDADRAKPPMLKAKSWAFKQVQLLDKHLSTVQFPDQPNWRRAETVLPVAKVGIAYTHSLTDGVDFWDPSGAKISKLTVGAGGVAPAWLTITKGGGGRWTLSGTPTENAVKSYTFRLRLENDKGKFQERKVTLRLSP